MEDPKIETVTPNKIYALYYDNSEDFDAVGENYVELRKALPEGAELLVLPKEFKLQEIPLEELISLRDVITHYIDNLPVNKE